MAGGMVRASMGASASRSRRRVVGFAASLSVLATLASGVVPGHVIAASRGGLLFVAPALLLAFVLASRRYPGEQTLERLRAAWRPRPTRPRGRVPGPRQRAVVDRRGGRLVGASPGGRAPPCLAGCA